MKVLISSKKAMKIAKKDFCWTQEGELLHLGMVCDNCDNCGCDRSFNGSKSMKATTVAEVLDMDENEAKKQYINGMEDAGWTKIIKKETLLMYFKDLCFSIKQMEIGKLVRVKSTQDSFSIFYNRLRGKQNGKNIFKSNYRKF